MDAQGDYLSQWLQDRNTKVCEIVSPVPTLLVAEEGTQKELLQQAIAPSGQSKATPMLAPFTERDSLMSDSLNLISQTSQMNSLLGCQSQTHIFLDRLVQTFPWLEKEQDLLEIAANCFLKDSDKFDFSVPECVFGKMSVASLAQTEKMPSRKSSKRLQVWGIAALGNLGMGIATSPKTENGFSSWAITAEVKATQPKQQKKSLAEIIGEGNAIVYRAADGSRLYHNQAPCLRSPNNGGTGAYKIREYQGETYLERPINATEAEQLMGWEVGSTAIGINQEGDAIAISQTQRIKMLGNGIIPAEITDILTAIKPILERQLDSEVPENMRFAYRQLRLHGMTHQEAMNTIKPA